MDPTALSVAARELRAFLAQRLGLDVGQVTIGHPSGAAREQETGGGNSRDLLNLFVYRAEPDAYPADGTQRDPMYLRAFCLLTALCLADPPPERTSAGEKDLRLIGGAMHWLHAEPFLAIRDSSGAPVASLQVVPSPFGLDDLNHLWATQGDLPYRLSVSYELALLPVPLAGPVARAPRVGSLGLQVGTETMPGLSFQAGPVRVDTGDPAWVPAIRFVDAGGALRWALSFTTGEVPAQVAVAAAGLPGTELALAWERWEATTGWQPLAAAAPPLPAERATLGDAGLPPATSVPMPNARKGQLQLSAARSWRRPDGSQVALRSNPLLISVHDGGGP